MHHRKKKLKKRGKKNNMRHSRKSRWFSAKTTSRETCETLSPNSYHLKGFLSNQMCGHAFFKSPLAVPPFPKTHPLFAAHSSYSRLQRKRRVHERSRESEREAYSSIGHGNRAPAPQDPACPYDVLGTLETPPTKNPPTKTLRAPCTVHTRVGNLDVLVFHLFHSSFLPLFFLAFFFVPLGAFKFQPKLTAPHQFGNIQPRTKDGLCHRRHCSPSRFVIVYGVFGVTLHTYLERGEENRRRDEGKEGGVEGGGRVLFSRTKWTPRSTFSFFVSVLVLGAPAKTSTLAEPITQLGPFQSPGLGTENGYEEGTLKKKRKIWKTHRARANFKRMI